MANMVSTLVANNVDTLGYCFFSFCLGILCVFIACFDMNDYYYLRRCWKSPMISQSGKAERCELYQRKMRNKKRHESKDRCRSSPVNGEKPWRSKGPKYLKKELDKEIIVPVHESQSGSMFYLLLRIYFRFVLACFAAVTYICLNLDGGVEEWQEYLTSWKVSSWFKFWTMWRDFFLWINTKRDTGYWAYEAKEIRDWILKKYTEWFGELNLPDITQRFRDIELPKWSINKDEFFKLYESLKYLRHCALVREGRRLLDVLVTLEWIPAFDFKIGGMPFIKLSKLREELTFFDVIDAIFNLLKTFVNIIISFLNTGDFSEFYKDSMAHKFEDDYTMLVSNKVLLDLGKLEMDSHEYDRILLETIDTLVELIDKAQPQERGYYTPKLKELRCIQTSRIAAKRDFIRIRALGLCFHGCSGGGKSTLAEPTTRYTLKVNGFDSAPSSTVTLNEYDKFQSEYRSHHAGVIFDDMCNARADKNDGNPLTKVIQFINNVPMAALNPNVEMKGNVMIEPLVVTATTNVKHLNASTYSNEPISILNRFPIFVHVVVKEEFRKDGQEQLDPDKVFAKFGNAPFPDAFRLTVEHAVPQNSGPNPKGYGFKVYEFEGKQLIDTDVNTFLRFVKEKSASHFAQQRRLVTARHGNANLELDENGVPVIPVLDSQFVSLSFGWPSFILSFEDACLATINDYIQWFFTTIFGQVFLAMYHRQDLFDKLYEMRMVYFMFIGIIILMDIMIGRFVLILSIAFMYLLYLTLKDYAVARYEIVRHEWVFDYRLTTLLSARMANIPFFSWTRFLSFIGGVSTLAMLKKLFSTPSTYTTSQSFDKKEVKTVNIDDLPKTEKKDIDPKYGSTGMRKLEEKYKISPGLSHAAGSSDFDIFVGKQMNRQWTMCIDNDIFCNAVPVMGNYLIVPHHTAPSKAKKTVLSKNLAFPKNVLMSPADLKQIKGTDFDMWYLPEMGTQKNLIEYYPEDSMDNKIFEGTMVYNDCGAPKRFPMIQFKRGPCATTLGGTFTGLTYTFPETTFKGLCMATAIGRTKDGHPFIAGHHLGGTDRAGCAGFLTRSQILDTIAEMEKERPSVLTSHSAVPIPKSVCGIDIELEKPHPKCVTNGLLGTAKCTVFGGHNRPGSTPSSEVVRSMISKSVEEELGLPCSHGKPHEIGSIEHKRVDIASKVDTAYEFDSELVDKACEDYFDTIMDGLTKADLKTVGILDLDATLAGYDGVQGINAMEFSTSAGFPFKGTKTQFVTLSEREVKGISCPRDLDPMIVEEMNRMKGEFLKGNRVNMVFKGALKDEPTKIGKKKVRVFAGCNIAATALVRQYFLTLSALMQRKKTLFECAVGVNARSPEWTELMEHIYKFGKDRVVAGDYKAFDARMSPRFMLAAFKILIKIAEKSGNYSEDDIKVMRGLATEICNPTYDYFGTLVQFFGSNPSGHPLTVVINSIVNSLYMRYTYYSIAKQDGWWRTPRFNEVASLMTYGDDNAMSVKRGYDAYNHTRIAEEFAKCGITYTMADKEAKSVPFINGSEAGFLKRGAVWDDELKLYRAPLDELSISKSLHAHIKSKVLSEKQHSAEAIRNAIDEYHEYGRVVYDKRKEELLKVAEANGIRYYLGDVPTYDERVERFCKDHSWKRNPNISLWRRT